jgi:hypothetical protein
MFAQSDRSPRVWDTRNVVFYMFLLSRAFDRQSSACSLSVVVLIVLSSACRRGTRADEDSQTGADGAAVYRADEADGIHKWHADPDHPDAASEQLSAAAVLR